MYSRDKYKLPQVVPEFGGDISEPLWEEEKETTYCSRKLNRRGKIILNMEGVSDEFN